MPDDDEPTRSTTDHAHAAPAVLVVDDDPAVRHHARHVLEAAGFPVREAVSGRSALALLREGLAVAAVVADLKMADGSGGWLLAQLAYEYPTLQSRVVVISGDPDGAGAAHVAVRWRCQVLPKPFTGPQLVSAVERLGDGQADVA